MTGQFARNTDPQKPSAIMAGVTHGSHICAFYETPDDLVSLVQPFFARGLSRGDACVWMMPDPLAAEHSTLHARTIAAERGIEIFAGGQFYTDGAHFARQRVVAFWNEKVQRALDTGYSGLCVSGDAFWLQHGDWPAFVEYEAQMSATISDQPISLLCTYPLSVGRAGDLFDVASAHHVAVAKRNKAWQVIKGWGSAEAPTAPQPREIEAANAARRVSSLSLRERQVLEALMQGRRNRVIAEDLGISARTVEVHRSRALHRLKVRTMAEAVSLMTLSSQIRQT